MAAEASALAIQVLPDDQIYEDQSEAVSEPQGWWPYVICHSRRKVRGGAGANQHTTAAPASNAFLLSGLAVWFHRIFWGPKMEQMNSRSLKIP